MTRATATNIDIVAGVREACEALGERQALDLRVWHLAAVTDFTDYFLICSGSNERQIKALADAVEERLTRSKWKPLHVEGYAHAAWILLDYGDFLVHVFSTECRQYYGLDRLWSDAPNVTAEFGL